MPREIISPEKKEWILRFPDLYIDDLKRGGDFERIVVKDSFDVRKSREDLARPYLDQLLPHVIFYSMHQAGLLDNLITCKKSALPKNPSQKIFFHEKNYPNEVFFGDKRLDQGQQKMILETIREPKRAVPFAATLWMSGVENLDPDVDFMVQQRRGKYRLIFELPRSFDSSRNASVSVRDFLLNDIEPRDVVLELKKVLDFFKKADFSKKAAEHISKAFGSAQGFVYEKLFNTQFPQRIDLIESAHNEFSSQVAYKEKSEMETNQETKKLQEIDKLGLDLNVSFRIPSFAKFYNSFLEVALPLIKYLNEKEAISDYQDVESNLSLLIDIVESNHESFEPSTQILNILEGHRTSFVGKKPSQSSLEHLRLDLVTVYDYLTRLSNRFNGN